MKKTIYRNGGAGALLASVVSLPAYADSNTYALADQNLLSLLNAQTEIATQTRLNIRHVPGIVDVFYGKQLRERGYQTVLDALSRLPGIQTLTNGYRTNPNVRGNISDALQGDLQILLNGVAQVSGNDLLPFVLLDMPLSAVERIEVIKGPGSAVYGEFAINGVINIITVSDTEGGRVFAGGGDFQTHSLSANQRLEGDDWHVAVTALTRRTDGPQSFVESDLLLNRSREINRSLGSNAPGRADTRMHYDSAIVQAQYLNTRFDASYTSTLNGDGFGASEWLTDGDEYRDTLESVAFQLSHVFKRVASGDLTVYLGHQNYDFDRRLLAIPEGFIPDPIPVPGTNQFIPLPPVAADVFFDNQSQVDRDYVRLKWVGELNDNHRLLLEAGYQKLDVPEAGDTTNFDFTTLQFFPEPRRFDRHPLLATSLFGAEREILSFVVQDEIRLGNATRFTIGARVDDDKDRTGQVSPRLALLHELSDSNILKLQLARAFRPPTLAQEASSASLSNERIDTLELQWIHQGNRLTMDHAAFVSWLENKLVPNIFFTGDIADVSSRNVEERLRYYGFESTLRYKLNSAWQFEANLAYNRGDGIELQRSEFFISPWTADLNATWRINRFINLFLEQRYFSPRIRRPDDPRTDEFPSQTMTNFSMTMTPPSSDKLSFTLSVENVFDRDIRAPSGWFAVASFPDDLPIRPRHINAAVEYRW